MAYRSSQSIQSKPQPTGEFVSAFLAERAQRVGVAAVVVLMAVPVALVAIAEGAGLLPLPFNLHLVDLRLPVAFKLHMLASGLALALIPLVIALRRDSRWHKPLGRLTAVAVLVGGLTSLPVGVMSESVLAARLAFIVQGIVWLALLAVGIRAAVARRFALHQRAMLSMAAVASGAIWVRLITAVAVGAPQQFDTIYGAAAWIGWVLPLAFAWRHGEKCLAPRPRPV